MLALLLAGCGGDNSANNTSNSGGTSSGGSSSAGNTGGSASSGSGFNPSDLQVTATGSYTSGIGLYYYIGVVKNNSSATLKQISASLVDDSGNVLPGDKAVDVSLIVVVLPPGKSAGFNIQSDQLVSKPSFKFTAQTVNPGDTLQPADLSVSNDKLDPK
jgi:hypothetical protein